MPVKDPSIYGPDWDEISLATKERAGWRCECDGRCGVEHTGSVGRPGRCFLKQGDKPGHRKRAVVLTVHHLDQRPWNHDPSNLMALCEGCHLRMDGAMHRQNAAQTRAENKGLVGLFGGTP